MRHILPYLAEESKPFDGVVINQQGVEGTLPIITVGDFLHGDFEGKHLCYIPSEALIGAVLECYAQHKMRAPEATSGVFVLPEDKRARWWPFVKSMRVLRHYAPHTDVATSVMAMLGGRCQRRMAVSVFYDARGAKLLRGLPVSSGPEAAAKHGYEMKTPGEEPMATEEARQSSPKAEAYAGSIYGVKGDHREARLKHELLLVQVRVLGRTCTALVDSGATHNIISTEFVERHQLAATASRTVKRVRLADGTVTKTAGALKGARYRLGAKFTDTEDFIIMGMNDEEFDVILGKPWLSKHNPAIDWSNNEIIIGGEHIEAVADGPSKTNFKVCSLKSTLKAAKSKGARAWTVLIRPTTDPVEKSKTPYSPSLQAPELKDWPELLAVLHKYKEVFEPLPDGPPKDPSRPKLKIELQEGPKPPYKPPYRMSPKELDELKAQIQGLLDRGWIRPSHSPFGAPVLFAAKPDGSLRMCIDYRALNAMTIKSRYPLPRIDELFDRMGGAKFISCLDLQQGYHQVAIEPEDVPKTAFVTRYGQFEWLVMPFGLCNAPSIFQAMMNEFLGADLDQFASAYLDDLSIYSSTRAEHVHHMESVLKRMQERGYRARLSKCRFGRPEQELLGFIVGNGKLRPSPKKVAAVKEWPTPGNVHDLRVFLGFTNFYRRFVQGYSHIAAPLTELFRKGIPWAWGEAQQSAFTSLKEKLTSAPALLLSDFTRPFYVVCDASDFAIGATLLQDHGNGLQPVAYEGRKLNPAESRYTTTDKENLALVHALRTWRCYLEGRRFTVETDHASLRWLQTQPTLNRRQARWMEMLAGYDMEIVHKPGKLNRSDPLSRREYPAGEEAIPLVSVLVTVSFGEDFMELLRTYYARTPMREFDPQRRYSFNDGVWYVDGKLLVPEDDAIKERVLQELHDAPTGGHFGVDKTLESVARRFWWKHMKQDVQLYCKTCPVCQRTKASNQLPAGLLQPLPTPSHPWEQMTMDLLLNLPTTASGHNGAVVFVDRLTKCIRWAPCNDHVTAEAAAKLYLDNVVRHHGLATVIISDRDPRFMAGFWQELHRLLGTTLKMSTVDHPQTDGQTENANKTLLQLLRSYCVANPRTWDELLSMAELAYNNHAQVSTGVSPFYATYGRHPTMPADLLAARPATKKSVEDLLRDIHATWDHVKTRLGRAQERQRRYADKRRRDVTYAVGDKVLVDTKLFRPKLPELQKLLPRFMGPFVVTAVPSPVTLKLELPAQLRTVRVVHVSRVKPFHETTRFGDRGAQPAALDGVAEDPEWEVDALLDRKKLWGAFYYLVHWKGYDHCEDCWICEDYLENCAGLVRDYDRMHPR